ncbi:MAG: hypothetical protein N3A69_01150, partial [Leptospiraceae bacterium]|nr:hypothetical protein [Leptospiraceae bacterium]
KYNISKYFFLDSSFPMIYQLCKRGERNIALRFSEFEGLDTIRNMKEKAQWIWVDCFTKLPLTKEIEQELHSLGYKICLVSPELQGREEEILSYKKYIEQNGIHLDAVCSKIKNYNKWISA